MKKNRTLIITLILSAVIVIFALIFFLGTGTVTHRQYKPFVKDLDGKSELSITTYPAGFPSDISKGPLSKKLQTSDNVYFQVHIRDSKKEFGPNPNVQSITIHSFSYKLDDGPETELISNYNQNFWMQANQNYDKNFKPPVPYNRDSVVSIEIDFTLNGNDYSFKGKMPAHEYTKRVPSILFYLGP